MPHQSHTEKPKLPTHDSNPLRHLRKTYDENSIAYTHVDYSNSRVAPIHYFRLIGEPGKNDDLTLSSHNTHLLTPISKAILSHRSA